MARSLCVVLSVLLVASLVQGCAAMHVARGPDVWREMKSVARSVPVTAPDHPGNVFLLGENVTLAVPPGAKQWRIADETGKVVAEGGGPAVSAGNLGIGWYRCRFADANDNETGYTTVAVLAPLRAPTPQDSPVCLDSASAWFARDDAAKQERFARLSALAGVNWVRDRMSWRDIEPERRTFEKQTTYDSSADLQARQGLKVLQVFHATPAWAADAALDGPSSSSRFPRDLRDQYAFCKAMAERHKGRVLAWEPWNEANISNFGGHTIDEMCSLQKAAYWGLKQGDSEVVVCWNVFAGGGTRVESEGVVKNETWPYFDTYNVHTYDRPEEYLRVFEHTRDAASGRPIWLSECGIGLHFVPDSKGGELTSEQELEQARFIARSYAASPFAGVNRHFFFILGNYLENVNQFGLLRFDQTPRPGYVALAAVGRLLAGAKCIGRIPPTGKDGPYVYAFRACPDGVERDVWVAWAMAPMDNPLPADLDVVSVHDYLGRPSGRPTRVDKAAFFIVAPAGSSQRVPLEAPPSLGPYRGGAPSPVVIQLEVPVTATKLGKLAHTVTPEQDVPLPLWVYNFSKQAVAGRLRVEEKPADWRADIAAADIQLAPMDRKQVVFNTRIPATGDATASGGWITVRGDFGSAGRPVLAFRLAGASEDAPQ